jgi:hypothetical protein
MEHGEYFFVIVEEFLVGGLVEITASKGEFEPGLGLGGFLAGIAQFIYEDGFVSSLAPGL